MLPGVLHAPLLLLPPSPPPQPMITTSISTESAETHLMVHYPPVLAWVFGCILRLHHYGACYTTRGDVASGQQERAMPQRFDAIIIGGGHNGLVTAAYLARAGLQTLV